jgi:hypothetical protein
MTEGNALTCKLSRENLAIAKKHLLTSSTSSNRSLRRWHQRLTVQAAMNALEEFRWVDLINACREGISETRGWIAYFAAEIIQSLPGLLLRRGRTKSRILKINQP